MFLFDTDVLSVVLRGRAPTHLVRALAATPTERQFTTAITLGEIAYGAARAKRPDLLDRARRAVLVGVRVLPFDAAAAERYGTLRAELERAGTPLAEPDLRIASIALVGGLTLVTGNVRHFARVTGLVVEDWISTPPPGAATSISS